MATVNKPAAQLLLLAGLSACTSTAPVEYREARTTAEIARVLRCGSGEIPFCTDANCEVRDYYCADKSRALDTIFPH